MFYGEDGSRPALGHPNTESGRQADTLFRDQPEITGYRQLVILPADDSRRSGSQGF
jgi:hypothetical protein